MSSRGGYGATRGGGGGEYHDDPGYREYRDHPATGYQSYGGGMSGVSDAIEEIKSNIFKINSGANSIEKAMRKIGTDQDSVQLRDKIHEISMTTNRIAQDSTRKLKAVGTRKADKQEKIQLSKIKNDFHDSLERFQGLQKMAAGKVKASVKLGSQKTSGSGFGGEGVGTTGWNDDDYSDTSKFVREEERRVELQEQQEVIEDDLALIREREERIRQLESDILDVNEIFRDLGALITEQGETLDTIEANVERTYGNVESGADQLVKASQYQRKARKKMCCLLGIFLVVAAIIAIIIVVSLKS